jgi:antitoxin YefM
MKTLTYSEASQNLAKTLDEIIENHSPVKITRTRGKVDIEIMPLEEYESLQETFYLLKNP